MIMSESFESFANAKERTLTENEKISSGKKKIKDHVGNKYGEWDAEQCLQEVKSYEAGKSINFTHLARKYNIKDNNGNTPGNAGQMVKKFLENNFIDIQKFSYQGQENSMIIRKKKRKLADCVSIPTEMTNKKLKVELKKLIDNGKYSIGELITPQKYEKLIIKEDGTTEVEEIEIKGRKNPLHDIRLKMTEKHNQYFRLFTEKEYDEMSEETICNELKRINEFTNEKEGREKLLDHLKSFQQHRNLQFWHDGSCVSNHSHVMMMINSLYDKAIYLTNEEYFMKYNKKVDVQSEIETPE